MADVGHDGALPRPPVSHHTARVVLSQVERALRQVDRTNAALNDVRRIIGELGFTDGLVPEPIVAAERDLEDAGHFMVVALRSAVRGHNVLERAGVGLPSIRDWQKLRELRNLHEHWDGWAAEPYGITDEPWLRSEAGRKWAERSETRPNEGSWGYSEEPDGSHKLRSFRGLELDTVLEDLIAFRDAVRRLEHQCFEYGYPDLAAAAELIGGGRLTLAQHMVTGFRAIRARDGALRYQREDVLRAGRLVDANFSGPYSEPQPPLSLS